MNSATPLTLCASPTTPDLLAAITLENAAYRARRAGNFDAAAGLDSLASAVRSGQLSTAQLHNSNARCRLFGGEAVGL